MIVQLNSYFQRTGWPLNFVSCFNCAVVKGWQPMYNSTMKSIILSSALLKTLNPTAIAGMPLLCRLATVSRCWKLIAQWIICQSYTMLESAFITLFSSSLLSILLSFPPLCTYLYPSITVVVFMLWYWLYEVRPMLVAVVDYSTYRKCLE